MTVTTLEHRLSNLEYAAVDIRAALSAAQITEALVDMNADVAGCSVELTAHLNKQTSTVLCAGHMRGVLSLHCQRCLEPARVDVDVTLHTVFTPAPANVDMTEAADDAEDVDYAHHDGESVDLWPIVREQLILAVPMKVLCKEDCRGLCSVCGIDLNITRCDCQAALPLTPFSALRSVRP